MRAPITRFAYAVGLAGLVGLLVLIDLRVNPFRLKITMLAIGTAIFGLLLFTSRVLNPGRPRQLHGTFSLRDRPWWTFAAVALFAGALTVPAFMAAAVGISTGKVFPATWWDIAWFVGAVMVIAAAVWALGRALRDNNR